MDNMGYPGMQSNQMTRSDLDYHPVSAIGYAGYTILFSLPFFIGLILTIVFAAGASKNVHVRNFARGTLIIYVIVFVLILIGFLIISVFFGGMWAMMESMLY